MGLGLSHAHSLATLAGLQRYEVTGVLGEGAYGQVYAARDRKHGEQLAIKVLSHADPSSLTDLKREFRIARDLASPHLVALYDLVVEDDRGFIVMPRVRGATLDEWARHLDPRRRPERLNHVLVGILSGLAELHRAGLVHRDIKPRNVIVSERDHATIVDFGLATRLPTRADRPSHFAGTPAYLAPELLLGADPEATQDIFALGVTAFELITGELPARDTRLWRVHPGQPAVRLRSAWHDIPAALLSFVCDALDDEPSRRISASEGVKRLSGATLRGCSAGSFTSQRLLGRESELAAAAAQFADRRCRFGVLGPSGIGKTTLIEVALATPSEPPLVFAGRCHPGERLPFRGFDELIESLGHWLASAPALLARLSWRDLALLAHVFPSLRGVLQTRPPGDEYLNSWLPERRRLLAPALLHVLAEVARSQPVIFWLDDVHWADPDGARLLGELLALATGDSVPIVVSGRTLPDEVQKLLSPLIELRPLCEEDARELACRRSRALRPDLTPGDVPAWQIAAAAGNPGLICQLGDLIASSARPCSSLADLVHASLSELPEAAVSVVSAMALFAQPAPVRLAHELVSAGEGRAIMHQLVSVGLVRTEPAFGAEGYALLHDDLRELIVARIAVSARPGLHAGVVRGLSALSAPPPELLARHLEGAGDPTRARASFLVAGQRANDSLAFQHAERCFQRALELSEEGARLEPLCGLAAAHAFSGRARQAAVFFVEGAAAASDEQRSDLLQRAAAQYFLIGENERAVDIVQQLLEPFFVKLPASRSALLWGLCKQGLTPSQRWARQGPAARALHARVADLTYEVSAGISHADVALGAYAQGLHLYHGLRAGCPMRAARAYALQAGYLAMSGASESTVEKLLLKARSTVVGPASPRFELLFTLVEAAIAWAQGRWSACVRSASEAERISERACPGTWWELGFVRAVMLDALRWSGRFAQLEASTRRYLDDAAVRGDRFVSVTFTVRFSATLHLLAESPTLATRACDEARQWPARGVQLQHLAEFHSRCEALSYQGDHQAAVDYAEGYARRVRHAPLLRSVPTRAKLHYQLASNRLAAAALANGTARARLLRAAAGAIRRLRKPGWPYTNLLADVLQTTIAALSKRVEGERLLALRAEATRLDMHAHAAALGLAASRSPAERARYERELRALGAVDPVRFATMLVPGLMLAKQAADALP